MGADSGLIDKRTVQDRIIERKRVLQMRSGQSKPARNPQVCARGQVTENKSCGVIALSAEMHQILVQPQRQVQFAPLRVIARLPMRNLKELRWRTQLLP